MYVKFYNSWSKDITWLQEKYFHALWRMVRVIASTIFFLVHEAQLAGHLNYTTLVLSERFRTNRSTKAGDKASVMVSCSITEPHPQNPQISSSSKRHQLIINVSLQCNMTNLSWKLKHSLLIPRKIHLSWPLFLAQSHHRNQHHHHLAIIVKVKGHSGDYHCSHHGKLRIQRERLSLRARKRSW